MVLAGVDGGHLSPDGIHVLAQGNPVLLRLILIGVEEGGECMDLVGQGLCRTRGDLWSLSLGVAARTSSSVSSLNSSGLPNLTLGSGMGRRCCTCSSKFNIGTLVDRHGSGLQCSVRESTRSTPAQ